MKKVLSVRVGSSSRDHTARHTFLGQECEISRQGIDGDFPKAIQRYCEMDGKVDAFGAGGVEFYMQVENRPGINLPNGSLLLQDIPRMIVHYLLNQEKIHE